MPTITKIINTEGRHPRTRVYLDGRYAFSLEPETAVRLKLEQELSEPEIANLTRDNERQRALSSAYRSLSQRPHSSQEIRQKLLRKQFGEDTVTSTIDELTARGLINDAEFASFWRENREAFRPRSRSFVGLELRRKGVAADIAGDATAGMDDEASALQVAEKKAKTLAGADRDTYFRRLGDYLRRRGYNYEVIQKTINTLWKAKGIN
jgi:regulatory protein